MSNESDFHARLAAIGRTRGNACRDLRVGDWTLRFEGLDTTLQQELARRWGPFFETAVESPADITVCTLDGGAQGWLDAPFYGERYRLEVRGAAERRIVVSYNFALCRSPQARTRWLLALTDRAREPLGRVVENAARFLLAIQALDRGGFALHAAAVLHEGRAYLYAGPSRAGKSTAVRASAPARSLGDDFGLVVPGPHGWVAPAVPFDSAERVDPNVPRGQYSVEGIWRLYKSDDIVTEQPDSRIAVASLLSCAAFPWAYPERATELLDHAGRFVHEGRFAHLHFGPGSDLFTGFLARDASGD